MKSPADGSCLTLDEGAGVAARGMRPTQAESMGLQEAFNSLKIEMPKAGIHQGSVLSRTCSRGRKGHMVGGAGKESGKAIKVVQRSLGMDIYYLGAIREAKTDVDGCQSNAAA